MADIKPPMTSKTLRGKALFAWLSIALLIVSLAVPVAQAPIVGSISIFGLQDGTAYWFIGFTIIAAIATFTRMFRLLIIPGTLVVGATFYYVYHLDSIKANLATSLQGNMFSGLAAAASASIHLEWGIVPLVVSGCALVLVGVLRYDTETLPMLLATNRFQFIEGGIALAVMFFGIAILPAVIPHLQAVSSGESGANANAAAPTGDLGTPTVTTTARPATDPKVVAMSRAISVGILEKGFQDADAENGVYSSSFTAKLQYHNLSSKTISGFKGALVFYDQFGERVQGFKVQSDDDLTPGQIVVKDLLYDYNQFEHADTQLRETPLAKLRVTWAPTHVNFADGSSISSGADSP
jgi:hypothetical protein